MKFQYLANTLFFKYSTIIIYWRFHFGSLSKFKGAFLLFVVLVINPLTSQILPHQDLTFRYYLKSAEPIKKSLKAPNALSKNKDFYLQYFPVISSSAKDLPKAANWQYPKDSLFLTKHTYLPVFNDYAGFDTIHNLSEHYSTSPFYVYHNEISNKEYRSFVDAMKKDSTFIKNYGLKVSEIYPDTNVWIQGQVVYNEAYSIYYFQHEAYNNYPVVGVSAVQARAYCKWLETQLKAKWANLIPSNMMIEVDLPTTAEWIAAYDEFIAKPLLPLLNKKYKESITIDRSVIRDVNHYNLLNIIGMKDGFILNVNGLSTLHGVKIYQIGNVNSWRLGLSIPMETSGLNFPKEMSAVNHFLGNVSEWTSTPAMGHLFNNKTYTYNISGTLVPNAYQNPSAFDLSKTLWKEEDMVNYYAVKGGNYLKDFYYTEPFAVEFQHKFSANAYTGFRPIIRFYPKPQ